MNKNISFHENNLSECSYEKLKEHLSVVYFLTLIFVESMSKILPPFFLSLYLYQEQK